MSEAVNPYFLAAAFGLAAIAAIHVVVGQRHIVRPLLTARDIAGVPRRTHFLCWHMVTMTLAAMAFAMARAALAPQARELAVLATTLAVLFAAWGLALPLATGHRLRHMPQGLLFLPVAALGAAGLLLP